MNRFEEYAKDAALIGKRAEISELQNRLESVCEESARFETRAEIAVSQIEYYQGEINRLDSRIRSLTQTQTAEEQEAVRKIANEKVRELRGYLSGKQTIQAIKLFREMTGAGLKDAKDFIDYVRGFTFSSHGGV